MTVRKSQTLQDLVFVIPLVKVTGEAAAGLVTTLSTRIIDPTGNPLLPGIDYDEAVFSEPHSDGNYVVKFPQTANLKAFTLEDATNPYVLILDSTDPDTYPTVLEVWIVSEYAWERKARIIDYIKSYS